MPLRGAPRERSACPMGPLRERVERELRPGPCQGVGSAGVVLFVASGTRTAQYWAYQRRLSLVGVGVTPPALRLHTRALGSVNSGTATTSSHSWRSAAV